MKYMPNGKATVIHSLFWSTNKVLLYKMSFIPEPYSHNKKIKAKLYLSDYATKSDLKAAPGTDTSKFDKKADLAKN